MSATILDGKALAARRRAALAERVAGLGFRPGLRVVRVGEDPASGVYVRNKDRAAKEAGFDSATLQLPEGTAEAVLPFIAVGLVLALMAGRALNALALGDEVGRALGAGLARTRVLGAVAITLAGIWEWQWLGPRDWVWMAGLCICGMTSHWLMIRSYEMAEASVLQPFAYTQLVWVSIIGVVVFAEVLRPNVVIGAAIVVAGHGTAQRILERLRDADVPAVQPSVT